MRLNWIHAWRNCFDGCIPCYQWLDGWVEGHHGDVADDAVVGIAVAAVVV